MASRQVIDTEARRRAAQGLAAEQHKQKVADWVAEQEKNYVEVEDDDLSPGNWDRQVGQAMMSDLLELKLKKIIPGNIIFQDMTLLYPEIAPGRAAIRVKPDGTRETICAYGRGFLPERSVVKVRTIYKPDHRVHHLDRKDQPKTQWNSATKEFDYVEGTGTRPGWKKVKEPYGEATRGWRTVLIHFVKHSVLSVTAVENMFGHDNTKSWASHLGKQSIIVPW